MFIIFANLLYLSQPRKAGLYVSVQSKPLKWRTLAQASSSDTSTPLCTQKLPEETVLSAAGPLVCSPLVDLTREPENQSSCLYFSLTSRRMQTITRCELSTDATDAKYPDVRQHGLSFPLDGVLSGGQWMDGRT